jgi:hypothetical protein
MISRRAPGTLAGKESRGNCGSAVQFVSDHISSLGSFYAQLRARTIIGVTRGVCSLFHGKKSETLWFDRGELGLLLRSDKLKKPFPS